MDLLKLLNTIVVGSDFDSNWHTKTTISNYRLNVTQLQITFYNGAITNYFKCNSIMVLAIQLQPNTVCIGHIAAYRIYCSYFYIIRFLKLVY